MKIAVVGLGLIGGSIFKRLRKEGFDVIGISNSQKGDNIFAEYSCLASVDVVFVATPMNITIETLERVAEYARPSTFVTDVCSLKAFLCDKEYPFNFIPSHPMAGTEFKGFENSFETLFEGAKWVITPIKKGQNTGVLEDLIKVMGAEPIYATPKEHDKAVALISHAPMVLAQALFKTLDDCELARKLASSGFRDMTRLAMSNPEMAVDMVELNAANIQKSILKIYGAVGDILADYNRDYLEQIANSRAAMYKDGKNIL